MNDLQDDDSHLISRLLSFMNKSHLLQIFGDISFKMNLTVDLGDFDLIR